jgi:protein-tyrosine phosphatase
MDIGSVLPAYGVELVRFPIVDPELPSDDAAYRRLISDLVRRIRGGARVAIACRGGLDRTGMTAGCLLREAGLGPDEAIDRVHSARDHTLTLPHQARYVRRWPA